MYRSYPVKTFYPGSALILETNGPSNSSIYIFWLMAPFDFRRTIFFYSSSTPRTKGKIKSQKSHIENQFIEIIKKWHDFGVKILENLNAYTRENHIVYPKRRLSLKRQICWKTRILSILTKIFKNESFNRAFRADKCEFIWSEKYRYTSR